MIKPAKARLIAYKDRTFDATITIQEDGSAKDLTNYTITAQVRAYESQDTYQDLTVTKTDATNGVITLTLTAAQTKAMTAGMYNYDVELTSDVSGESYNYLEGSWMLYETTTRDES